MLVNNVVVSERMNTNTIKYLMNFLFLCRACFIHIIGSILRLRKIIKVYNYLSVGLLLVQVLLLKFLLRKKSITLQQTSVNPMTKMLHSCMMIRMMTLSALLPDMTVLVNNVVASKRMNTNNIKYLIKVPISFVCLFYSYHKQHFKVEKNGFKKGL